MLEAKSVSKSLGGHIVLNDICLSVRPGEVVGLVGLNGAGKSTLLEILSGSTRPDRGQVWVDGWPVAPALSLRRWLGRRWRPVFRSEQTPRLFNRLSVADNLSLGRWAVATGKETLWADDSAGKTALELPPKLLAGDLSVGQRRRIVFEWLYVRLGLVRYFLLDEPAAGGDEQLVRMLFQFLAAARRHRCGVLLVEHRDGVLQGACDRLVYLFNGRLFAEAPAHCPQFQPTTLPSPELPAVGTSPRLMLCELSVARGGVSILDGVSLKLDAGHVVAVTGPNGCGKSSLLRSICGDDEYTILRGDILLEGRSLSSSSLKDRLTAGVHLMPQEAALFQSMTVGEALRVSVEAVNPGRWTSRSAELIRVQLPMLHRIWGMKCGTLSGGERRTVSFGRILLLRPKVALLDEPMAGLDADGRRRCSGLLAQLARSGAAVLVAEQQAMVPSLNADQVFIIGRGNGRANGEDEIKKGVVINAAIL